MNKNILKITAVLGLTTIILSSCSKENPPLVYFPDMYFPVAYDPLMEAQDAYTDRVNEIPAFVARDGATGLIPVDGTVSQNKDGIVNEQVVPKNMEEYNAGYEISKSIASPLNTQNMEKDLERGKYLYELTCTACHGTGGDGQGPMVLTGAYSGVPKFTDREITIGSIHYVLTNGRNAMGSYAGQLTPGDRWRVALYVYNAFKAPVVIAAAPTTEENTNTK